MPTLRQVRKGEFVLNQPHNGSTYEHKPECVRYMRGLGEVHNHSRNWWDSDILMSFAIGFGTAVLVLLLVIKG